MPGLEFAGLETTGEAGPGTTGPGTTGPGTTGGGEAGREELGKLLEERFLARPVAAWVAALQAAGLGAHEVIGLAALMADPGARDRRMSVTQVSPEVGEVTMPGIAIKMSATPPRLGEPARQPGADAREVLQLAGLAVLAGQEGPLRSLRELEQLWAVQATGLPAGWETMTGPQGTAKEVQP